MKNYTKTIVTAAFVLADDHIKVAGSLYRVSSITKHDKSLTFQFYSVEDPDHTGILTFHETTRMKIWNQK